MLINLIIWLSYSKRKLNQLKYRNEIELKHVQATTSESEKIILRKQLNNWDKQAIKYRERMCWYIVIVCVLEIIVSVISQNLLIDVFNSISNNMNNPSIEIPELTRLLSTALGNVTNIITTILLFIYLRNDKIE